jgi:hypothetical protein
MLPPAICEAIRPQRPVTRGFGKGSALTETARNLLLLCISLVLSGSAATAAASSPKSLPAPGLASTSTLALGDFDGDRQPDLASIEFNRFDSSAARYWITVRLTSGGRQTVEVIGPLGGLDISARDVNGDAALDLIVRTAWQHRIVAVFLNDGHGHFAAADPSAFSSAMESSSAAWLTASGPRCEDSVLSPPGDSAAECEGDGGSSPLPELRHAAFSPGSKHSRFSLSASFGRAPPAPNPLV